MGTIHQIYGQDPHSMTKALMLTANVVQMIPAGACVALKPNLVVASAPDSGATTHAGVLSGCIEYLQENGIQRICVIEGSWVGDETGRAARACGYDNVCARYHVPFYDLKEDKTRTVATPLRNMEICCRALDADFLINLPVLKGHCQTAMTCALKNCKGCIPDHEKRRFHAEGLMEPIAALAAALRPQLTIVDSICGDLNFEEGGTPIYTNHMYLGCDPVQIDAYGCQLMGLALEDVPYIGIAERWHVGSTHIDAADIVSLNHPQETTAYPSPTGMVRTLTKTVRADSACSACYAALVRGLYIAKSNGCRPNMPIAIGQGYRGTTIDGLGIGVCCAGATHCVTGCPPTAQDIANALS